MEDASYLGYPYYIVLVSLLQTVRNMNGKELNDTQTN